MSPEVAAGIRARNRAAIEAEILATAGRHLAEQGAAALSLRAVARDLGMASSAVYRYVASRDELLTTLIVAAYTSLGDQVETAVASGPQDPSGRFLTIGRATRAWAVAHPHQWALLFGSPVPGYAAPADRTNEPGTRVARMLLEVLADLDQEADAGRHLANPDFEGVRVDPGLLQRGLAAWTLVLGAVNAELFEYFGPDVPADRDAHFEAVLTLALDLVAGAD